MILYDAETINSILDAGFLCHVGLVQDDQPFVIPTLYVRVGARLYLHGSPRSRLLQVVEGGVPVCITVTHVDGLVLARSAFHHSINYRSVIVLGRGQVIAEQAEKEAALHALIEHILPGRSEEVRGPSAWELRATQVLAVPLLEASVKVRSGPPKDASRDYGLPIWAGELPLRQEALAPIPDARGSFDLPVPAHVERWRHGINERVR